MYIVCLYELDVKSLITWRREKNHARGHAISAELVGDTASGVRKSFAPEFLRVRGLQKSALSF